MITSIAFTAFSVTNMARSKEFYENVLGLKIGHNFKDKWVEYSLANSTFAITTTDIGHRPGAKGAVIAFEVKNLDSFVKTLKDKSVTFIAEPFPTPVCRMAVIQDPDGNEITIHQRH